MGKKQTVDVMISGGKATAAPPLGPALGPLKVNIGQVVAEINKKTADFAGMQVPVKVTVDTDTKEFEISIGTPPVSALVKQEANVKKGSGNPKTEFVGNLTVEQAIKVAGMKSDALLGKTLKNRVKEIAGTADSIGITVDGKKASQFIADVNAGQYNEQLK